MRAQAIQFLRTTIKSGSTLTFHSYGAERLDGGGYLYTYRVSSGGISIGDAIADAFSGIALGSNARNIENSNARCIEKQANGVIVSPVEAETLTLLLDEMIGSPEDRPLMFNLIVEIVA